MSKLEKPNPTEIQSGITSMSRMMVSSASSTGEKTEDDVADEMDACLACDSCKKLIGNLPGIWLLDCGHFYCFTCSPVPQDPKKHISCGYSSRPSSAFTRELSPSQIADHDGELSQDGDGGAGEKVKTHETGGTSGAFCDETNRTTRLKTAIRRKSNSARRRKRKTERRPGQEQMWYFSYLTRPVVVSIPYEATYADLMSRLFIVLNIDRATHQINVKMQKTSSDDGEGEFHIAGEPVPLEVGSEKVRLSELKIPRRKMLILEVKKRKSAEGTMKDSKRSREKESAKNNKSDCQPSLSPS